jgi:hypothetical protein
MKMNPDEKELVRRSYQFEVRAEQDEQKGSIITGRPIVYNSATDLGWFTEIIERGALDKTDLSDVRFLVNHNTDMIPLARSSRGNIDSTMKLDIDVHGMAIHVNLDTENNSEARALYSAVQRGDITGMSFMFRISEDSWEGLDTDKPTRHITGIEAVYEVSAVTFPAYEATEIQARDKKLLEQARQTIPAVTALELEKARFKALFGGGGNV